MYGRKCLISAQHGRNNCLIFNDQNPCSSVAKITKLHGRVLGIPQHSSEKQSKYHLNE